ncbi:PA-phosphatase [Mycolicibacterium hodleri]|uniref:PA-phosphatase n=1 Tax=Mycolicibacterium hodleri TaxID=49897 RepID=A0A502E1R2_9MYCO|nr:PA-phosphatase [Mycolicibacterium hodleri]TPG31543.1 PA-phosphatase [Mycolicibacterium hodleri]
MTAANTLRWWPPVGILAMVALGLAVGHGSTPLDDWFIRAGGSHPALGELLWFTYPPVLQILLVAAVVIALYRRRWRVAAAVALTPLTGVLAERLLKWLFGREREGALSYPSGHVTVMVAVLGMVVLAVGVKAWLVSAAAVFALLGLLGQSFTYHYFTDTIGAAFLGTALVCVAYWAAKLDRCQPRCDLDHSGG